MRGCGEPARPPPANEPLVVGFDASMGGARRRGGARCVRRCWLGRAAVSDPGPLVRSCLLAFAGGPRVRSGGALWRRRRVMARSPRFVLRSALVMMVNRRRPRTQNGHLEVDTPGEDPGFRKWPSFRAD